jgi:superfamily II DNA or RNA helicase
MGQFKLRPYQETAVKELREALAKYRRVIFQLGTGGGKSCIFSYIAFSSQKYNRKVLILSDRSEILKQNGGALQSWGLDIDYISPKHRDLPKKSVVCAMSQTMKRRVEKQEWRDYLKTVELLIIDEAHTQTSDFIHPYVSANCFVLGVTATPQRSGHMKQLGEMYHALVTGVTTKELIAGGYLSKCHHYSIAAPSLEGVHIDSGTGDYNKRQLAQRFENHTVYAGVVDEYIRLTPDKKAICFCVSSEQAIGMTSEFCAKGISAKYVLSGDFDSDGLYSGKRSEVFDDFSKGKFQVLVNVGIATAGFDAPDVEVVILNFSTVSLPKYLQSVGRGSRVTPNKNEFYVLDAGRNYARFGLYDADRTWLLWHDEHSSTGMQQTKLCDPQVRDENGRFGCGCLQPSTVKVCKECGYVFPTEKFLYDCHLEEVFDTSESTIEKFVAEKRLSGWKMTRILVQVCLANPDNERKAFMEAYKILAPDKTMQQANGYWYIFKKNVWEKVKHKQQPKRTVDRALPL